MTEMANREAFIDFVHGLLNINPLERWTPQQARTHPFITQQKFTGPFQPRMDLKPTSRSPAPGVQQQQQAEALSRQRQQQAQAAQVQQAANAAYANAMHGMTPSYPTTPTAAQQQHQQQQQQQQQAAMYQNMYSPSQQGAPPPYPSNPPVQSAYGQQMPMIQQPPPVAGMNPYAQQPPQNLYAQATTRAGRQRASTMDGNGNVNGIPSALQRVVSHLDPNQPIRLQPSPAYYPPPQDGQSASDIGSIGSRRRASRAAGNGRQGTSGQERNFVRMLEDRTLEEGWNGKNAQWPGSNV